MNRENTWGLALTSWYLCAVVRLQAAWLWQPAAYSRIAATTIALAVAGKPQSKVSTGLMVAPDRESAMAVFSSGNG
jgi:hypothetical protein